MSQVYLIGVDLGTSVVKATLLDAGGAALADASRDAPLHQPGPGLAEQRAEDFYAAALQTIGEVVSRGNIAPGDVAAIAFDGQMGGLLGIDQDWQAVTPWYPSTLDTRYQPYLTQMADRLGDRLVGLTGAQPIGGPRLLWWKAEQPEVYRRIHKVMILANYVAGRMAGLSGDDAIMDPSYLTWMGLADTARRAWSTELVEIFELSLDKLPRIVPATTVIGSLTGEAARACGLLAGIPLVAGAGDQVASCLGAGLVRSGQLVDGAGTFSVLATCLDHFLADTRYGFWQSLASPLSENHWYPLMYIGGGGLTHRWFRDQFSREEIAQAEVQFSQVYQLLDSQATDVPPGADGLLFIPHLAGRACPGDPEVRGAWLGFTWTHQKPHFYRAVLEAIAYDYAQALGVLRSYFPDVTFSEVRVIGGGANSGLWNQIKADVLGLPYVRLQREDVAALGCAVMAGAAVGLYPDLAATASQFVQTTSRVEPRPAYSAFYQDYVAAYSQAFDQLKALYGILAVLRNKPFGATEQQS
jgi:xylulokinase